MKKSFVLIGFLGILIFSSCAKKADEPVIIEVAAVSTVASVVDSLPLFIKIMDSIFTKNSWADPTMFDYNAEVSLDGIAMPNATVTYATNVDDYGGYLYPAIHQTVGSWLRSLYIGDGTNVWCPHYTQEKITVTLQIFDGQGDALFTWYRCPVKTSIQDRVDYPSSIDWGVTTPKTITLTVKGQKNL